MDVEDIVAYTLEVVRLMCLEFYRHAQHEVPIDVIEPIMPGDPEPEIAIIERLDRDTWLRYLGMCLDTLAEEDRDLILAFYGAGLKREKTKIKGGHSRRSWDCRPEISAFGRAGLGNDWSLASPDDA